MILTQHQGWGWTRLAFSMNMYLVAFSEELSYLGLWDLSLGRIMLYVCLFCLHLLEFLLLVPVSAETKMWYLAVACVHLPITGDTTTHNTVVQVKGPILPTKDLLMPRQ